MRIVVTGAAGNLGRQALDALAPRGVELVGIDHRDPSDPRLVAAIRADLAVFDDAWAGQFGGADVVLHLAAEPSPRASWARVQEANLDVSNNVLRAVEQHGVRRVVFASSNWVLGGYRFTPERLTPDTPPWPINPYGYSKAATERDCAALHARLGTEVLALRLGYCQKGENRPGPKMAFGRWGQEMWLSNDDWRQAAVASCTAEFSGFAVLNVMSDNAGMRWDLSDTERLIGYRPASRHRPRLTPRRRLEDTAARIRSRRLRPLADALGIGARW